MKNFFLVFILAFFITACTHNQMTNTSLSDKQKIEKIKFMSLATLSVLFVKNI